MGDASTSTDRRQQWLHYYLTHYNLCLLKMVRFICCLMISSGGAEDDQGWGLCTRACVNEMRLKWKGDGG